MKELDPTSRNSEQSMRFNAVSNASTLASNRHVYIMESTPVNIRKTSENLVSLSVRLKPILDVREINERSRHFSNSRGCTKE